MPPKPPPRNPTLDPVALTLYSACTTASTAPPHSPAAPKIEFTSSDLLALNIVETVDALLPLAQSLINAALLQLLTNPTTGALSYRLRHENIAGNIASLDAQAQTLYKAIEATGTSGAWTKSLRNRTGLHQNNLTKCLKTLEHRGMIKQTRNVKFPGRKLFMLSSLEPTEEATGGPWFSDGELDVELVEKVSEIVVMYLENRSWRLGPKRLVQERKRSEKVWVEGEDGQRQQVERERVDVSFADGWGRDAFGNMPATGRPGGKLLLPHPEGYQEYPVADDVLNFIDANAFVEGKEVRIEDVRMLLEVLEFDGKVERVGVKRVPVDEEDEEDEESESESEDEDEVMRGQKAAEYKNETMYRSVRVPYGENVELGPGSSFADTPCARCPVFRLCEDGGTVDARSCGYFEGWLAGPKSGL